jgi:hypothetical protein
VSYLGALLAQARGGPPPLHPVLPARFEPDGPTELATEVEGPVERATQQDAVAPPVRPVPKVSTVPPRVNAPQQSGRPGIPAPVARNVSTVPPGSRVILDPVPVTTQDDSPGVPQPHSPVRRVDPSPAVDRRPTPSPKAPSPIEPKPLIAAATRDPDQPPRSPEAPVVLQPLLRPSVVPAPLRPAPSGPNLPIHVRRDEPTTVRVSIGRVEVRSPPAPAPRPAPVPWRPRLSLDDYLRERSR